MPVDVEQKLEIVLTGCVELRESWRLQREMDLIDRYAEREISGTVASLSLNCDILVAANDPSVVSES